MYRLISCPPSFEMERHGKDEPNDDAESGTKIHAVLALEASTATLNDAELETCDMCNAHAMEVIKAWNGHDGLVTPDKTLYEQRLGMTAIGSVIDVTPDSKADFVFTGQADLILIKGMRAIVIDYKTGRGDTPVAADNPQLAALAVLAWWRYRVTHVTVAIVQPWNGKPTVCEYGENALLLARGWLMDSLNDANTSTLDDLRAGDWCKYCKAKLSCPAFAATVHNTLDVLNPLTLPQGDSQRAAMFARAMELPDDKLIAAYRGLPIVRQLAAAIDGAFRSRVEAGELPGWAIETKPGNREVTDAQKAFEALAPLGVTAEDMLAAASVSIGSLEQAVKIRSGIKSQTPDRTSYNLTQKAAAKALNEALESAGAMGRKAEKKEIVELNQITE